MSTPSTPPAPRVDIAAALFTSVKQVARGYLTIGLPIAVAVTVAVLPPSLLLDRILGADLAAIENFDPLAPMESLSFLLDLAAALLAALLLGVLLAPWALAAGWAVALRAARGERTGVSDLRAGFVHYVAFAAGMTWWQLAAAVGGLLFVLPGAVAGAVLSLFGGFVIEHRASGWTANREAWRITEGCRTELTGVTCMVLVAGLVLHVVTGGVATVLVTLPVYLVWQARLYVELSAAAAPRGR